MFAIGLAVFLVACFLLWGCYLVECELEEKGKPVPQRLHLTAGVLVIVLMIGVCLMVASIFTLLWRHLP